MADGMTLLGWVGSVVGAIAAFAATYLPALRFVHASGDRDVEKLVRSMSGFFGAMLGAGTGELIRVLWTYGFHFP